jgi:hypothetical protein
MQDFTGVPAVVDLAAMRDAASKLGANPEKINPLVPESWDYFCLEDAAYHGRLVTIFFDRTGTRYGKGAGLRVLIDGVEAAHAPKVGKLTAAFASRTPPPTPTTHPAEKPDVPPGNLARNPAGKGFPEPSASFTCPSARVIAFAWADRAALMTLSVAPGGIVTTFPSIAFTWAPDAAPMAPSRAWMASTISWCA